MGDLSDLKSAIAETLAKVEAIPEVSTPNVSSATLKAELVPLLRAADERLRDIESIRAC